VIIKFNEVLIKGYKVGKCLCGKRRSKTKIFTQTLNPFNKNEDGTICTRDDILLKLAIEKNEWLKEQIYCKNCDMPSYWGLTSEQREFYDKNGKDATIKKFFLI